MRLSIKIPHINGAKILRQRVGVSLSIAFVILLTDYFLSNWLGYVFDDTSLLSTVDKLFPLSSEPEDDIVYFNVGYDKELVAVRDEMDDSIGNTVITNREVLLRLLDIAEQSDYRYLFLDVRFERGFETSRDSLLFAKLVSMDNIVISTHGKSDAYEIADPMLECKTGMADYMSTYFSGFTKYGYLQDDSVSVALRMYRDLDGGDLKRFGPFFISGGRLCSNLQFLTFYESDIRRTETPAFGGEYLSVLPEERLSSLMHDKILVVGDMVGDVHNTYVGDVPGCILSVRAYQVLREGRHILSFWMLLFLLVVYAMCTYFVVYSHTLKIPHRLSVALKRYPLLSFLMFILGWGFVLLILKIVVFEIFQYSIIITVPSVIFSILSMPSEYGDFKTKLDN